MHSRPRLIYRTTASLMLFVLALSACLGAPSTGTPAATEPPEEVATEPPTVSAPAPATFNSSASDPAGDILDCATGASVPAQGNEGFDLQSVGVEAAGDNLHFSISFYPSDASLTGVFFALRLARPDVPRPPGSNTFAFSHAANVEIYFYRTTSASLFGDWKDYDPSAGWILSPDRVMTATQDDQGMVQADVPISYIPTLKDGVTWHVVAGGLENRCDAAGVDAMTYLSALILPTGP